MKKCEICFRETIHYIHSTTRYFKAKTGRPTYIFGDKPYIVCAECYAILVKLYANMKPYIPSNIHINRYKLQQQYRRNMALLPRGY